MKKIILLLTFLAIGILLANCASDIILPKPPSLTGKYYGWFVYDTDTAPPDSQAILWDFDDADPNRPLFRMSVNVDSPDLNPNFCLCEVFGLYDVKDRIELRPNVNQLKVPDIGDCTTCNPDQIPSGQFSFIRIIDTVKLTQSSEQLTTQLILLPLKDTTTTK